MNRLAVSGDILRGHFGFEFEHIESGGDEKYHAGIYRLGDQKIVYRKANMTPKKIGQFVAIWRRNAMGKAMPYHEMDQFDIMLIECMDGNNHGHFVFDKDALIKLGLVETPDQRGKNGCRLYPSWVEIDNLIALKTKSTQLEYFIDFNNFNKDKAMKLYRMIK